MSEILKSVLMGLGCLCILAFVGCSMMGAGVMVAADRAADKIQAEKARDSSEKSPWDK
jgi:threonine dehydrogenase-like Zn-dependent dehydrogenase